jgi:isopentenyl-diphosphate Delta-isomerase
MPGRIAVVDESDHFVRWEERRTIHELRLVHRTIHVALLDREGRLVVQRRHRDKQTHPSHWDLSCSGHVEESDYHGSPDERLDDVYGEVARREVLEELGVEVALRRVAHVAPIDGVHYEQIRFYIGESDGPWRAQAEEVEEVRAVTRTELAALSPLTPTLRHFLGLLGSRALF